MKNFENQKTPAMRDHETQMDQVKNRDSHRINNCMPNFECYDTCPGVEDQTRIKPEFVQLFQNRTGFDRYLLKKFKVDETK